MKRQHVELEQLEHCTHTCLLLYLKNTSCARQLLFCRVQEGGGGAEAALSVTATVALTVSVLEVRATHPTLSHPSLMYF